MAAGLGRVSVDTNIWLERIINQSRAGEVILAVGTSFQMRTLERSCGEVLERVRGFEPPTNGLGSRCATPALHPPQFIGEGFSF